MFTIPSSTPTVLMLPSAQLAATASDRVTTRQTNVALPAPLSNQATADSTSGPTNLAIAISTAAAAEAAPSSQAEAQPSDNTTIGSSSSFLAQLYSQAQDSEDSAVMIATSNIHFAPAPEYNTLVQYGYIKYKPSDAGIPQQNAPSAEDDESAQTVVSEYKAYAATSARNQSQLAVNQSQVAIGG